LNLRNSKEKLQFAINVP